jgi:hypothetical protein
MMAHSHPSFNLDIIKEWVVNIESRPLYPRKRAPVQTVQDAGWVVRDVRKYLDLQWGSNPQTVQPVASRYYNDSATPSWVEVITVMSPIQIAAIRYHHAPSPEKKAKHQIISFLAPSIVS